MYALKETMFKAFFMGMTLIIPMTIKIYAQDGTNLANNETETLQWTDNLTAIDVLAFDIFKGKIAAEYDGFEIGYRASHLDSCFELGVSEDFIILEPDKGDLQIQSKVFGSCSFFLEARAYPLGRTLQSEPNLPIHGRATIVDEIVSQSEHQFSEESTVSVNIKHTWIGDLIIELIAPSGESVILHNQSGGGQDDIIGTYGKDLEPYQALSKLHGENLGGTWQLSVTDLYSLDDGVLLSWKLVTELPSVASIDKSIELEIANDIPEGWDGTFFLGYGGWDIVPVSSKGGETL